MSGDGQAPAVTVFLGREPPKKIALPRVALIYYGPHTMMTWNNNYSANALSDRADTVWSAAASFFKTSVRLILPLLMVLIFVQQAAAHPHVFLYQKIDVVFDDRGVAGFHMHWLFDDMFSSMIVEDYDTNKNGRLEESEVAAIKENAFASLSEHNYFTFITIAQKPFAVKQITDFTADCKDSRLTYHFFVPCHISAGAQPKKITVAIYDPTYYAAIFFSESTPVSLKNADKYKVSIDLREDPDTTIYFGMIHPWTLFLEFGLK